MSKKAKQPNTFDLEELKQLVEINPNLLATNSITAAEKFCKKIALSHYENFPVGSILIPKQIRKHFYSIYTFSRIADDIADEDYSLNADERLKLLNTFLENTISTAKNNFSTTNPIFIALRHTINEMGMPFAPFEKLIKAFKIDVLFVRPNSIDDLTQYCKFSANPIGELILRLFGEYNTHTAELSDAITSALQLINFWQDLSIDLNKGRNYIPKDLVEELSTKSSSDFNLTLHLLLIYSEKLLNFGKDLPKLIKNRKLKFELKVIINAGFKILEKEQKLQAKLFEYRPKLRKLDYLFILLKSLY